MNIIDSSPQSNRTEDRKCTSVRDVTCGYSKTCSSIFYKCNRLYLLRPRFKDFGTFLFHKSYFLYVPR